MSTNGNPVLRVEDLSVAFKTKHGYAEAVRGLSYDVMPRESVAIVGESGSGKSVNALALLGLLPRTARVTGSALFEGEELIGMEPDKLRKIRGRRISMIFQDPMTAFNPVFTIGNQIAEIITIHDSSVSDNEAMKRATDLLDLVGIPHPERRVHQYPHEYSGGMRQRAMIAMAIANSPTLLIADEPTTALDVTIQAQVMETLAAAQQETGAAMVLITHDLGLVAGVADRVQVMYGGRIFERAETRELFYNPINPYTRGLIQSIPRLNEERGVRLNPIPGNPPSIIRMPKGCAFSSRCEFRTQACMDQPAELEPVTDGHWSRCHNTATLPPVEDPRLIPGGAGQ
jgi:oligopeptide/dipeptide ABC transporter ATP-binding protein